MTERMDDMSHLDWQLTVDEPSLRTLASQLASAIDAHGFEKDAVLVIGLSGDLGSGKTTFARALIRASGHQGPVKSPTYGLLESYELEHLSIHHLDLYRIADPEELEWLGLRELTGLMLIEWPEQGGVFSPPADISIKMAIDTSGRQRDLLIKACSDRGSELLSAWKSC